MKKLIFLLALLFITPLCFAAEDAKRVTFTPAGTIAATNVQAAIEEVASEVSGDVTAVGDCLTGDCFTGTSGNTLTFKGATSGTTTLKPTAIAGTTAITLPAETGTVCTTGSVCSGYQASGAVTSVSGTAPVASSGGATPAISMAAATSLANGYLSSADWTTFNSKAAALSGIINEIAYFNSASTIASLAVASYPSLAELAYVKGVTSAIQTQINGKQSTLTNSAGLLGALSDETGTSLAVFNTNPTIDASASGSIRVLAGANPTVSAAGAVSVDTSATTGSALRFYGDAQYTLPAWQKISFTIDTPIATSDYSLTSFPANITIRQIRVLCTGGTNLIGGLDEADLNGATPVAVDADITATAGTTATDDGTLTNPTIAANAILQWHTTSISGTPTSLTVTIFYTYDAVA